MHGSIERSPDSVVNENRAFTLLGVRTVTATTAAPVPLWAVAVLAIGLMGFGSRRSRLAW